MSYPRFRLRGRRGALSSNYRVAAILGVVAGVALVGMVTLSPYSPWGPGPSAAQLSTAECSRIESTANLSGGIVHLYYGNGNRTGPGSGLINQSPPGLMAYPNESTAVANVVNGWTTVCTSHDFYELEKQWGPTNASWSGLAQNRTGIYEYVITIDWQAGSSQCTPNHGYCIGTAEWLVNVASGAVSGPSTNFVSPGIAGNVTASAASSRGIEP